jgi:hypothetical protein
VGTYTLVVDFPGDTIWSGVEERLRGVKVREFTSLVYDGPQELIAGLPQELHFELLEASSLDPMEGREVQVEIDGSILDMVTDEEGGFALNITPEEGELSIGLLYEGETLYDGNATEVVLQAFPPEVSFYNHRMVRGEENLMVGRAHAGDRPLPAQPVEIETGFWKSTNITSDHNGYLSIRIDVPAEMELGVHPSSFNLSGIGVKGGLELTVAARPELELSLVGDRLTARLTDDRGDPIEGEMIRFKAPGLEAEAVTGEDGRTAIDIGSLEEGNVTVTFPGSDLYVGVTSTIDVGEGGLPLWLIAIVVMIGALGIASIARRSPGPKVTGERTMERRPEVVRMPSNIRFPDLPEGMPPVWEEGRPIRVIVEDARGLTARVDGHPVDGRWDGNDLMITLVLGKGAHRMSIEDETGSREVVISIVDYREEMVRLYGDAVEGWERRFPRIGKSMTSMEMHSLLLPYLADKGDELTTLIRLFEVANYSDHPVSRREYESLYRAFRRVAYG